MDGKTRFRGYLALLILHILRERPLHAYGVIKELRRVTGHGRLSPGAVYPILKGLLRRGLVETRVESRGERSFKVYAVSEKGLRVLEERRAELEEALKVAERFKIMGELGAGRVFRAVERLFHRIDSLGPEERRRVRRLFESFEREALEILGE